MLPALTFTEPASPIERVDESINPPLMSDNFPKLVTSTLPALPLLSVAAVLLMDAELPIPSMKILPAVTLTEPASPFVKVNDLLAPSMIDRLLSVLTSLLPARPLLSDPATFLIPAALPCPSIFMLPAVTLTEPASPIDRVEESIIPPLIIDN